MRTLAVVGLGLIGGSLVRAVREAGLSVRIRGADRDERSRRLALEAGAVDEAHAEPVEAARGADLVVLAIPVLSIPAVLEQVARAVGPGAVITDVGSTKAALQRRAEQALPAGVAFVGGHPVAGTENSGFEASFAGLFRGARCLLTPGPSSPPEAVAAVRGLWEAVGCRVELIDAATHDRIFAVISHLPHVVAYALVNAAAAAERTLPGLLSYTGGGFRDFTRIAASHPAMWRDICLDNRGEILAAIDGFLAETQRLRAMIRDGDAAALEAAFGAARTARRSLGPLPARGPE